MQEIKVYMTGCLNDYGMASLKTKMQEWGKWLRHRIRGYSEAMEEAESQTPTLDETKGSRVFRQNDGK